MTLGILQRASDVIPVPLFRPRCSLLPLTLLAPLLLLTLSPSASGRHLPHSQAEASAAVPLPRSRLLSGTQQSGRPALSEHAIGGRTSHGQRRAASRVRIQRAFPKPAATAAHPHASVTSAAATSAVASQQKELSNTAAAKASSSSASSSVPQKAPLHEAQPAAAAGQASSPRNHKGKRAAKAKHSSLEEGEAEGHGQPGNVMAGLTLSEGQQSPSVLGSQLPSINVQNNGGSILLGAVRVYLIFYGSWQRGGLKQRILETFVRSFSTTAADKLGASVRDWWLTTTLYYQPDGRHAGANVSFAKSVFVPSTKALPNSRAVQRVVVNVLAGGKLPQDGNGVYAVLVSPDVKVQGMCDQFCGFHSRVMINGRWMKYLFAGDSTNCRWACTLATTTNNGDFGADVMCNTLAHELTESVTDPDTATGWFDPNLELENADLCQGFFPRIASAPMMPPFNVRGLNGHKWLLQGNVDPRTQQCVVGMRPPA